jgi:WD40 repeat protein
MIRFRRLLEIGDSATVYDFKLNKNYKLNIGFMSILCDLYTFTSKDNLNYKVFFTKFLQGVSLQAPFDKHEDNIYGLHFMIDWQYPEIINKYDSINIYKTIQAIITDFYNNHPELFAIHIQTKPEIGEIKNKRYSLYKKLLVKGFKN